MIASYNDYLTLSFLSNVTERKMSTSGSNFVAAPPTEPLLYLSLISAGYFCWAEITSPQFPGCGDPAPITMCVLRHFGWHDKWHTPLFHNMAPPTAAKIASPSVVKKTKNNNKKGSTRCTGMPHTCVSILHVSMWQHRLASEALNEVRCHWRPQSQWNKGPFWTHASPG